MMNKKTIAFLSVLIFLQGIAFAQVPGYMGKRLTIGYSNNFFLAGIGPTKTYDIGLNTTHSFNLEYTIKNRTNFCLSYQMFKTGVDVDHEFYEEYEDTYGVYNSISYTYNPIPNVPLQLKSNNVSIGFKFFASGTLAPVGKYKKLELLLLFSNLTYKPNSFEGYDNQAEGLKRKSIGTGNYSYSTFALTYTMGRQRVLLNRLVLDYGVQFGFTPAGVVAVLTSDEDFNRSTNPEDIFRQETNKRLFRYELFNLHLGLGFLAF